jgi:hypothetical protein
VKTAQTILMFSFPNFLTLVNENSTVEKLAFGLRVNTSDYYNAGVMQDNAQRYIIHPVIG